ncbi:MAG: hypothetical protein ABI589_10645, partial [Burkholderiales bacterium]
LFLRADRQADGTRTFRLVEAEPLETSYGEDLYREIFEDPANGRSDERGAASPAPRSARANSGRYDRSNRLSVVYSPNSETTP